MEDLSTSGYLFMAIIAFILFFLKGKNCIISRGLDCFFLLLSFFYLLFRIVLPEVVEGTDRWNYMQMYDHYVDGFMDNKGDFGFYYYTLFISSVFNKSFYFFALALLYLIPLYYVILKVVKPGNYYLFSFILFSFFFTYSLGDNVIRQGIASSLYVLGGYFLYNGKMKRSIVIYIIACSFHLSMLIPCVFIFVAKKTSLKGCFFLYLLTIILATFNFNLLNYVSYIPIIGDLYELRAVNYFNLESGIYKTGFRLDFVIFNSVFLLISMCIYKNYYRVFDYLNESAYKFIIKLYMILSSFFFMTFVMEYSDRYGLMSWILIPYMLAPILVIKSKNKALYTGLLYLLCVSFYFLL